MFFTIPLRKQVILREKLKFPSGTATALMYAVQLLDLRLFYFIETTEMLTALGYRYFMVSKASLRSNIPQYDLLVTLRDPSSHQMI